MPFLTGESDAEPHKDLYWRLGARTAYRLGDWKLLKNPNKEWQLYNLAKDPGETVDLSGKMPDLRTELIETWNAYAKETGVVLPELNIFTR